MFFFGAISRLRKPESEVSRNKTKHLEGYGGAGRHYYTKATLWVLLLLLHHHRHHFIYLTTHRLINIQK